MLDDLRDSICLVEYDHSAGFHASSVVEETEVLGSTGNWLNILEMPVDVLRGNMPRCLSVDQNPLTKTVDRENITKC